MTKFDFHYFAASAHTWMTTDSTRDLPELIKLMEAEKQTYNLFYVPVDYTIDYDIKRYQPQVEGTIWMGSFGLGNSNRKVKAK